LFSRLQAWLSHYPCRKHGHISPPTSVVSIAAALEDSFFTVDTPEYSTLTILAVMPGLIEQLDGLIADLLAGSNIYTYALVGVIVGFIAWTILDIQDPDTHPLLLARQSQASYVRQPGESAIFRCPEIPHGCMSKRDV
jgi:hypothetical protein